MTGTSAEPMGANLFDYDSGDQIGALPRPNSAWLFFGYSPGAAEGSTTRSMVRRR